MKANSPKAKPQTPHRAAWYNRRAGAAGLALLALVLAYLLGSRAEDTGSLQQYFLTIVLLIFAINRLARTVRPRR